MYQSLLHEARKNLAEFAWTRTWYGARKRQVAKAIRDDKIGAHFKEDYARQIAEGRVVWGAIAQANMAMFSRGELDYPANIVFSVDEYFESRPDHLHDIASRIFKLKGTQPDDPVRGKIAAVITDESNCIVNWRLPYLITDGFVVYLTSIMLHRVWLPNGYLATRVTPIVVHPQVLRCCVLPLKCWPKKLLADAEILDVLDEIDDPFIERPITHAQLTADEKAARQNPHHRPTAEELVPGAAQSVVSLTPDAASYIKILVRLAELKGPWHLRVIHNGADEDPGFNVSRDALPHNHEMIVSQHVNVAYPRAHAESIRGTVIHARRTLFGEGLEIYR